MTRNQAFTMYGSEFPKEWQRIAFVDESQGWDVDQTAIHVAGDHFVLATASGCSCWDGDWDVEHYDTLHELFEAIGVNSNVDRMHNPSMLGVEDLRSQVEIALNKE